MNKKQVMYIVSPIMIAVISIGLYIWSNSGIEGWYRAHLSVVLNGSSWYINLENGKIHSYEQSRSSSSVKLFDTIGSYELNENGWYVLVYDKGRFFGQTPIRFRAKPGLFSLVIHEDDLKRLDIYPNQLRRMFFWDFW